MTVHTLDYLIETSPELTSAVLAASSKFFLPESYSRLVQHAQTLVSRSVSLGTCDIGLIQALMILVCWKAPTDRSAFIKIGMAVRLGYQHGWYRQSVRTLPHDERDVRLVLVGRLCGE